MLDKCLVLMLVISYLIGDSLTIVEWITSTTY